MPTTLNGYETKTSGSQKDVTVTDNGTEVGLDVVLRGESVGVLPQVDVNIQDQTTQDIDLLLQQELNVGNLLAADTIIDDKQITLTAGHGAVVGNSVCFREGKSFTQEIITAVNVNLITLDSPLDKVYTTAADICIGNVNMAVNGSVTPVIFKIGPLPAGEDKWDLTRILGNITDDSVMDDSKFGGISALTNGIFFRRNNGVYKNLFNVKTNGELSLRMYDTKYSDKAPAGTYGFSFRRTWAGQSKSGVTIRLDSADSDVFECVVQDDLTGLTTFKVAVQGHVVE